MRTLKALLLWAGSACSLVLPAHSQSSFQNLDFELANVVGYSVGGNVPSAAAIPGWSVFYFNTQTSEVYSNIQTIWYDGVSLGGYAVSINDVNLGPGYVPIQGNYDITLMGGIGVAASITQTGVVPVSARTLLIQYSASVSPVISLDGQMLDMVPMGNVLYGADVSSFSGLNATLTLTAPPGGPSFFTLDDITFSSVAVPEPNALGLAIVGLLGMGLYRCQKRPN